MLNSNFGFNSNEETKHLIVKYEKMLADGEEYFFDQNAFEELIEHYQSSLDFTAALGVVNFALTQHAYSSVFYIRKAQLLLDLDAPKEALEYLDNASMIDSSELEISLVKADALCQNGDFELALDVLDNAEALSSSTDELELILARANVYEDWDKFEASYKLVKKAIHKDPKNKAVLDRLNFITELAEKHEESIALYKLIIDEQPYNISAWYNLGISLQTLQRYTEASEAFEYAFIIDPKFEIAYYDCAECLVESNDYYTALKIYKEALEEFGENSTVFNNIGECYENMDDLSVAQSYYIKAIASDPNDDHSFYKLGKSYAKEGKWQNALDNFTKSLKLNENQLNTVLALGEAHFQLSNESLAIEFFESAIEMSPQEPIVWIQYASTLIQIELYQESIDILDQGIDVCNDVSIHYAKAGVLLIIGNRQQGLEVLEEALALDVLLVSSLFKLLPDLEEDEEIQALITRHKA